MPVAGESATRAQAAVRWILRAHAYATDDGVPLGYFPCHLSGGGWRASYPETTGYIITSLLAFDRRFDDPGAREAALAMSRWEVSLQMASGAVQGGTVAPSEEQTPAAFNTGMVLDGWCSVMEATGDSAAAAAAQRAADFLVGDMDAGGYFRTNGKFVRADQIKTYTCLCAWALHRFGRLCGERLYADAAVRSAEAAIRQQRPNGWFANNCLTHSDAPLTHTLGYTLQGILEVGAAEKRSDMIESVERSMYAVITRITDTGFLHARHFADWTPASFSSCLTGSAQISIVGYRLYQLTGNTFYRDSADRLLDFVKGLQSMDAEDESVLGALPGSFPLFGEYMRGGYPNWATKYLLDALLLQEQTKS